LLELDFNVLYLVTRTWNTSKTSGFPKTSANFSNAFWVFGTSSSQGLGKEKAIEKIIQGMSSHVHNAHVQECAGKVPLIVCARHGSALEGSSGASRQLGCTYSFYNRYKSFCFTDTKARMLTHNVSSGAGAGVRG
jgi:hypothetical protein